MMSYRPLNICRINIYHSNNAKCKRGSKELKVSVWYSVIVEVTDQACMFQSLKTRRRIKYMMSNKLTERERNKIGFKTKGIIRE